MNVILGDVSNSGNQFWWIPLVSTAGAFGGTIAGIFWSEQVRRASDRKRLAATLAAEISGVVAFLNRHAIQESLISASTNSGRPNIRSVVAIRGSFLGASGKIQESLGLLPTSLSAEASEAIIHLRGLIEEFTTVREAMENEQTWTDQAVRDFCVKLAHMIRDFMDIADILIPKLQTEAKTDWPPHLRPPGEF
jgi:hypothetical protein